MLFWLISGVMGYAITPFFALTAILMVVLNAKLADIVTVPANEVIKRAQNGVTTAPDPKRVDEVTDDDLNDGPIGLALVSELKAGSSKPPSTIGLIGEDAGTHIESHPK